MQKELGWSTLAERRRRQRLVLVWKVLKGELDIPPSEVGLFPATRPGRGPNANPLKLTLTRGKDTSSPLWRATSVRTIKDFNALSKEQVEADSAGTFSKSLKATSP